MDKNTKNTKNRIALASRNPCNEFLIQFLLKLRQNYGNMKMMRGKNRPDHQYLHYTRAIESIRKYPLPIICEDQLSLLAGIGQSLTSKLTIVVKQHYKKFLKNPQSLNQEKDCQKKQNSELKQHAKTLNWNSECSGSKHLMSAHSENSQQYNSEHKDKMQPYLNTQKAQSQCDSKSVKSQGVNRKGQFYKPRQGTQAANVLRVLKILDASSHSVTKKDIDKCLLQNDFDKVKQWKNLKQTLLNGQCIILDPSVDYEAFFITPKGLEFAAQNQIKQNSNITKKKMVSQICSFKSKMVQKQIEQASISQTKSMRSLQGGQQSNSRSLNNGFFVRKPLQKKSQQNLIIIVDVRQMKDQSQRTYFQQTLTQKYKIDVVTQVLTIGDFAFCYNGQILDYIIQRKKADDLSASIIDGRYKQQKFRLKNCGASNIIYIYQGHPSQNSVLKQKQLMNGLIKTRVADRFKVFKTARVSETVKILAQFQKQIQRRIDNEEQVITIGCIEEFNKRNAKNRYMTGESIFGLGLKCFPNVGKQTVANILRYFKCYKHLYTELQKYNNNMQRVEFLNGLLKGGRTQAGVTLLIVEFLFGEYDKISSSQNFGQNSIKSSDMKTIQSQ